MRISDWSSVVCSSDLSVHAVFHKAPGAGRKPTVLYIPGMDATKDDYPSPYNNEFTRRGMNVCSMDGPGQGECNLNRVWLTTDNYARSAQRVKIGRASCRERVLQDVKMYVVAVS